MGDAPYEEAITESAKAAQEVAKTTGKAIDAASGLGGWVSQLVGAPLAEIAGIATDHLAFTRSVRALRLKQKYEALKAEMGEEQIVRPLPAKVAIPLIAAASLEENDELHELWARLLANATSPAGPEVGVSFVSILREMGPMEVRCLWTIAAVGDKAKEGVWTARLPDRVITRGESRGEGDDELPPTPVAIAVSNLVRLGCLTDATFWEGPSRTRNVTITPLGEAMVAACTVTRGTAADTPA